MHHLLANLNRGCRRDLRGHRPSGALEPRAPEPGGVEDRRRIGAWPRLRERDSVREALFRRRWWRPGFPDDIPDPVDHEIRDLRPDDRDRVDLVDLHLRLAHRHVDVDPAGECPLQQRPSDGAETHPAVPDHAVEWQDNRVSQLAEAHHRFGRADAHQRLEDLPVVVPVDRRADEHPDRLGLLRVRDRDTSLAVLQRGGVEQLAAGAERIRNQFRSVVVLAQRPASPLRYECGRCPRRSLLVPSPSPSKVGNGRQDSPGGGRANGPDDGLGGGPRRNLPPQSVSTPQQRSKREVIAPLELVACAASLDECQCGINELHQLVTIQR